jgi:cysteine desulfurase
MARNEMKNAKRIYLDYAATTPVDPAVLRAMQPYFSEKFGNAGSLHAFGQEAMAALDRARESIARSIGADFREVIFTGSATEANNLAIRGALKKSRIKKPKIIVSAVEHESILETVRDLEFSRAAEVIYLPVDRNGTVDTGLLKKELDDRTVLVSVMFANNEVGAIQPILEISKVINEFGRAGTPPLFHTDAAQAFQFLPCTVSELGVDLMTLSAHKIYGPKGAGALYVRAQNEKRMMDGDARLRAILTGGGQELGLRSGTENIPAIVGFAKAVELADMAREKESTRIQKLRNLLSEGMLKIYPRAEVNGGMATKKLPNILNVYFPGRSAEDLLTRIDLGGLAASSGSACRARAAQSSYVIEALGYSKERAGSSVRFSLGRPTSKEEILQTLRILKKAL